MEDSIECYWEVKKEKNGYVTVGFGKMEFFDDFDNCNLNGQEEKEACLEYIGERIWRDNRNKYIHNCCKKQRNRTVATEECALSDWIYIIRGRLYADAKDPVGQLMMQEGDGYNFLKTVRR